MTESAGDRELLEEYLRELDEKAFLALYRRHTPALFGLASRLCGRANPEAEEIVQEAWVRAAQAVPSFRWDSSLRTWLCRFVLNCWRERARAHHPDSLSLEEPAADEIQAAIGQRIDLAQAVAELPDGFRSVLVLHDVEGFTHEEIGRLLGIEPGTSKSQLARARQALRRRLGARGSN